MAKNQKKKLEKKNWKSQFTLIGEAKINDYTYKIDEKSEKSDWVYNSLNLGVNCGSECGTVYAEMMGGYGSERDNVLYVHGKNDDGSDDFENRYTIDWDDREDDSFLADIGDLCFITVGIEKDKKGNTFTKKFLSPYDAIAYIKENLVDGTVVNVKGNIEYSVYQEKTQVRKRITSLFLSKKEHGDYYARFSQTMLLNKESMGKVDKEKSIIPLYAKVLEYQKMWKNKEVKCLVPLQKTFEYQIDMGNEAGTKKLVEKYLRVKKGVTEITFDGMFIESGALVTMTEDDLPDDIKELISIGAYTLDEALARCTEGSSKEKRMVLLKPFIRMVGDEGSKTPVVAKTEQRYSDEDLILDFMMEEEDEDDDEGDEPPFEVDDADDSDDTGDADDADGDNSLDWLNELE